MLFHFFLTKDLLYPYYLKKQINDKQKKKKKKKKKN